jgi:hypothetical protein
MGYRGIGNSESKAANIGQRKAGKLKAESSKERFI